MIFLKDHVKQVVKEVAEEVLEEKKSYGSLQEKVEDGDALEAIGKLSEPDRGDLNQRVAHRAAERIIPGTERKDTAERERLDAEIRNELDDPIDWDEVAEDKVRDELIDWSEFEEEPERVDQNSYKGR